MVILGLIIQLYHCCLLRQLNSLSQVTSIIKPNINYSYLYLRPDLKYLNKFDTKIIKNYKNDEFYTPKWGKFGGLNDRLGFGNKSYIVCKSYKKL